MTSPAREFRFTDGDFERVRRLIYQHAGISLAPIKKDMVYSRLARRLRALGMTSFDQYLAYLEQGHAAEWETFVNSLTTNLTSFFRESHHFDILKKQLAAITHRPIRLWCAAASTGEEAWSLAITACEAFDSLSPPVQILASDIDTHVLATAERGIYPLERVERLSPERLKKFFLRGTGVQEGHARVRPELQKLVSFARINLLDAHWPAVKAPLDAIFCRNVMIYFDKPTQYQILKKFVPLLHPDGLLYAGHSESFLHAADLFRSLGRTVYERADRVSPRPRLF
ncbi:MAG: chemotaxis protein CheR [Rhodocyclaceae bacterium]|nr:chemotaxis protein CheR [Rhodocyclaceae bacterium]